MALLWSHWRWNPGQARWRRSWWLARFGPTPSHCRTELSELADGRSSSCRGRRSPAPRRRSSPPVARDSLAGSGGVVPKASEFWPVAVELSPVACESCPVAVEFGPKASKSRPVAVELSPVAASCPVAVELVEASSSGPSPSSCCRWPVSCPVAVEFVSKLAESWPVAVELSPVACESWPVAVEFAPKANECWPVAVELSPVACEAGESPSSLVRTPPSPGRSPWSSPVVATADRSPSCWCLRLRVLDRCLEFPRRLPKLARRRRMSREPIGLGRSRVLGPTAVDIDRTPSRSPARPGPGRSPSMLSPVACELTGRRRVRTESLPRPGPSRCRWRRWPAKSPSAVEFGSRRVRRRCRRPQNWQRWCQRSRRLRWSPAPTDAASSQRPGSVAVAS